MSDSINRCVVEQSFIYQPSELFVSDNGSNLYSIDLRTGGILCGYKGGADFFLMSFCIPNVFARDIWGCYINQSLEHYPYGFDVS